jgi:hypothetical protein
MHNGNFFVYVSGYFFTYPIMVILSVSEGSLFFGCTGFSTRDLCWQGRCLLLQPCLQHLKIVLFFHFQSRFCLFPLLG